MSKRRTNSSGTNSEKSYPVGFSKPPKDTQFKPGQSGNPKGRPKKSRDWHDIARDVLFELISIRVNGKLKKVPAIEAQLIQLRQKALEGDPRAGNQILRLLPILRLKGSEESAEEGLTREQIEDLDRQILKDIFGDTTENKSLPSPRIRKRKGKVA